MIKRFKKLVGIGFLVISLALSGVTTTVRALEISSDITAEQPLDAGDNKLDTATVEGKITIKGDGKITVKAGEKATLDLNGRTLAIEKDLAIELEDVGTELTITDSSDPKTGKIICGAEVETCLSVGLGNKLFLEGVTIKADNAVIENVAGEVSIIDSTITSENGPIVWVSNHYDGTNDYPSKTEITNSVIKTSMIAFVNRQYDGVSDEDLKSITTADNEITINLAGEGKLELYNDVDDAMAWFEFATDYFVGEGDQVVIKNIEKEDLERLYPGNNQAFEETGTNEYIIKPRADYGNLFDIYGQLEEILIAIEDDRIYTNDSVMAFYDALGGKNFDRLFGFPMLLSATDGNQEKIEAFTKEIRALLEQAKLLLVKIVIPTPVAAAPQVEEVYVHYEEEAEPEEVSVVEEVVKKPKKTEKEEEVKKSNKTYFIIGAILLVGLVGWRILLNKRETES